MKVKQHLKYYICCTGLSSGKAGIEDKETSGLWGALKLILWRILPKHIP